MLFGCANSTQFVESSVAIPDLPKNIKSAGAYHKVPEKNITKPDEIKALLIRLAESDRRNARAVQSCKFNHKKLQLLYNTTKAKE